jgi:hypothetical protein
MKYAIRYVDKYDRFVMAESDNPHHDLAMLVHFGTLATTEKRSLAKAKQAEIWHLGERLHVDAKQLEAALSGVAIMGMLS